MSICLMSVDYVTADHPSVNGVDPSPAAAAASVSASGVQLLPPLASSSFAYLDEMATWPRLIERTAGEDP